jgi:hypothetical protein
MTSRIHAPKDTANKGRKETLHKNPLAEGIVPLDKRRRRSWSSLTDEKLISYGKRFMREKGINRRNELKKAVSGLYETLRRRGLLDRVGFQEKRRKMRPWKDMKDEMIIEYTIKFMEEKDIGWRIELLEADQGLYDVLWKRGLLDMVGLSKERRDWSSLTDNKLVSFAKNFLMQNEINGRVELQKADGSLYNALWRRGLLDRVGFQKKRRKMRSWKQMDDEELMKFARKYMKEKGITKRKGLERGDHGLYAALRKRKLLDLVFADIEQSKVDAGLLSGLSQAADAMESFGGAG